MARGRDPGLRGVVHVGSIAARPCSGPMCLLALVNTDAAGHHASEYEAGLGAVKASALRADRACACARLRALTAPAPSFGICTCVMAGKNPERHHGWLSLTWTSKRRYSANISAVSHDTTLGIALSACRGVSDSRPQGTIQRSIEVGSVFVHRRCTNDWFTNEAGS